MHERGLPWNPGNHPKSATTIYRILQVLQVEIMCMLVVVVVVIITSQNKLWREYKGCHFPCHIMRMRLSHNDLFVTGSKTEQPSSIGDDETEGDTLYGKFIKLYHKHRNISSYSFRLNIFIVVITAVSFCILTSLHG